MSSSSNQLIAPMKVLLHVVLSFSSTEIEFIYNARTAESVTRPAGQKLDSLLILTRFMSSALISLDSIHTRFMDPPCCSACQASWAEARFILDSWTVCTDQPGLDSYSIHGSCLLLCLTGKQGRGSIHGLSALISLGSIHTRFMDPACSSACQQAEQRLDS